MNWPLVNLYFSIILESKYISSMKPIWFGESNVLQYFVVTDFQHKSSIEKLHLNQPQNCHTKHYTRHYAKLLLAAGVLSARVCRTLSVLSFSVIVCVVLVCAFAYLSQSFFYYSTVKILVVSSPNCEITRTAIFCPFFFISIGCEICP